MLDSFNDIIQNFHFLRPYWLLAFIPLAMLLWFVWHQQSQSKSWLKVVDEKLQPFVLTNADEIIPSKLRWLSILALIICIISLAGPVWEKLPQSVYKPQSAVVIALDLSRSMDAQDIKPSRLERAKLKIIDFLNARKEGQVALIAYAAQPYTVSPLTDDNETIVSLLKSLSTDIMPVQGSRMDKAIIKANELMAQANVSQGHIIVVSDGVSNLELAAIKDIEPTLHTRSILAVGTEEGAPINLQRGGFLKNARGEIVVAKMNRQSLLSIAQDSTGVFATLRNDDADINALLNLMSLNRLENQNRKRDQTFDVWYEPGSWLLLLAVPMILMAFRKGLLVFFVAMLIPVYQPAEALDWQSWFKNDNQKALEQFNAGNFDAAKDQFEQKDWRAASQFKNQEYDQALEHYAGSENNEHLYNKGNALAKLERYEEALEAWEELLKENPNHQDAAFNKKVVEEFLKHQQQQNQQQDSQENNEEQDQQQNQENQDQQNQQQNQNQDQENQQQQQDQQQQDQSSQQQSDAEKNEEQEQSEEEKSAQEQDEHEAQEQKEQANELSEEEKQQQEAEQQAAQQEFNEQQDPLDEETKQWLRRVPDDPGGLMRNKFRYQYKQLNNQNHEQNPW